MKLKISILAAVFAIGLCSACSSGDRSDHTVSDTAKTSTDGADKPISATKTTTTTGDATLEDNSGSGGQKISKDTSLKKSDSTLKKTTGSKK